MVIICMTMNHMQNKDSKGFKKLRFLHVSKFTTIVISLDVRKLEHVQKCVKINALNLLCKCIKVRVTLMDINQKVDTATVHKIVNR